MLLRQRLGSRVKSGGKPARRNIGRNVGGMLNATPGPPRWMQFRIESMIYPCAGAGLNPRNIRAFDRARGFSLSRRKNCASWAYSICACECNIMLIIVSWGFAIETEYQYARACLALSRSLSQKF